MSPKLTKKKARRRARFRLVVLHWRKFLGYKLLSNVADSFDEPTLRKLQETFASIDQNASGALSPEDFGRLFAKMKMPLSKTQLLEIVHEVDIDGSGTIDFEEFLLVIKNTKNMRGVQSKLGVALRRVSAADALANVGASLGGLLGPSRATRMHDAMEVNRAEHQTEAQGELDARVKAHHLHSADRALRRKEASRKWLQTARLLFDYSERDEDDDDAAVQEADDEDEDEEPRRGCGRASVHDALATLGANPDFVEGLGFVPKNPKMYVDAALRKEHAAATRRAQSESNLRKAARRETSRGDVHSNLKKTFALRAGGCARFWRKRGTSAQARRPTRRGTCTPSSSTPPSRPRCGA